MALPASAHWTSAVQPLSSPSLLALQGTTGSSGTSLFGGCSSGGKWSWLARNSVLEVVDNTTGNRCSAFQFGRAVGASGVIITCVKEYRYKDATHLLIGLKIGSNDGMLCIFDPHTSKVVLAVDIPQGVTAVEPVSSAGGLRSPGFALGDQLRLFFGVVAVGTEGGHTYLVDVRSDEGESCDEVTARGSRVISPRLTDVGTVREKATSKGEHLCLHLDEDSHSFRSFSFRKPDNSVLKSFYPSEVWVTSLAYIRQTGTLAVGFNLGCFQLWELSVPVLEYSSMLSKQPSPVTHFAYQEPADDPQYFCYLWVGRGPQATEADQDVPTNLHMFQLMYNKKEIHDNYGHLYKELISCEAHFLHDLTLDPYSATTLPSEGSRIISCYTLVKEIAPGSVKNEDSMCDEEGDRLDLGLTAFVWEARSDPADGQDSSSCYLGLFDLNRWYHAQMPRSIRLLPGKQGCPFFAFHSLDSILQAAAPDFLTALHVDPTSVVAYVSSHVPAPEQHFQPASLSLDVTCLMEAGLVRAKFLGQQREVLANLCQEGPPAIREPRHFFNHCWLAGLLPRRYVSDQGPANATAAEQREALLTIAVEHNLISLVVQCINSWTHGDLSSGCNLRTILDWAWGLVTNIKQSIDQLCIPFYNGEGSHIDDRTHRLLDQHAVHLGHMITVIQSLLDQSATTTEQGLKDLETKCNVVTLIHQHLKAVIWFVRNGLLPEALDEQDCLEGQFCYPSASLRKIYARRRSQLQNMCKNKGDGDILMIDGLVSEIGPKLTALWDRKAEGGTGLYPPPSFHALLDMYLVDTVPMATKHCIVGYFLLDVLHVSSLGTAQKEQLGRRIDKFCQSFSLPLGVTKLLHGFSLLDRKEFEDAIDMLLDPTTSLELAPWQHRHVVKAFLYQNESKKALQYFRTARPPFTSREDVKLFLTVLLANGLTAEAFHFQRRYRDDANMEELLTHLILGSQQTKTVDQLLKLPLDEEEEAILERYLQESAEPNSQELLVMHYLQRAHFVEAIRLNEKLKQQGLMVETDPAARERALARNAIVESYSRLLPPVQRRLAFSPEASAKRATLVRREILRPKPLSAVINPAKTSKVLSNAMLINSVLDRIAEARAQTQQDEEDGRLAEELEEDVPTMEPFVGTPITPRTKSRFGDLSSVVYPEVIGREVSPWKRQPSPVKPRPFLQPFGGDVIDRLTNISKAQADYSSASALSLLQTPPVTRRTPSRIKHDGTPTTRSIPSILKVRSTGHRVPTATREEVPKKTVLRAKFEVDLPTPPSLTKSALSQSTKEQGKSAAVPKRISFAEDTKVQTPSPVAIKAEPSFMETDEIADASPAPESPDLRPDLSQEATPDNSPPPGDRTPSPGNHTPSPGDHTPSSGDHTLSPGDCTPSPRDALAAAAAPPSDQTPPFLPPSGAEREVSPGAAAPLGGLGFSPETSPGLRASPQTEKFEVQTGIGMLVDDEISFNFEAQGTLAEIAMDFSALTDEEPTKELEFPLQTGDKDVSGMTLEEEEAAQEFEEDFEDAETWEEEKEEAEERPLYPSDLIPSPRPPIRHSAPNTATPRLLTPSRLQLPQDSPQPRPSPKAEEEEEDFVTPQPTPDRPDAPPAATPAGGSPLRGDTAGAAASEDRRPAPESVKSQTSPPAGPFPSAETSVQTTPGLALRQGGALPARVPFEVSLVSAGSVAAGSSSSFLQPLQEPMTPPTSGEETGGEFSSSDQPPSQDEESAETDAQPSDEEDIAMETSLSGEVQMREPMKIKRGRKSAPATPALSFIFSPPHTRSRTGTRRHAQRVIDEVMTPRARPVVTVSATPATSSANPLLPTVGPTPSLDLGGATPAGMTTPVSMATPLSVGATPKTAAGSTRRGRRSHTPKMDTGSSGSSTRVSHRSVTPVVMSETASAGPVTRSRRSITTPQPSPAEPVVLLSPLEESAEASQTPKQERPKRLVRIAPHSMTLRTPKERKLRQRNVKLW